MEEKGTKQKGKGRSRWLLALNGIGNRGEQTWKEMKAETVMNSDGSLLKRNEEGHNDTPHPGQGLNGTWALRALQGLGPTTSWVVLARRLVLGRKREVGGEVEEVAHTPLVPLAPFPVPVETSLYFSSPFIYIAPFSLSEHSHLVMKC